ncbi:MAG: TIGR02466 family protein [Gammaproteobacteria bacterium]|nr:TIGR02466 family protein [Gammaproteobacteria bacterium]
MSALNLIFATPFLRLVTDDDGLTNALRELILSCETEEFRKKNSPQQTHEGVFESEFDFLSWSAPAVQQFKTLFYNHVGGFVKLVNEMTDEQLENVRFNNHCWFHISREGAFFQPHNHPNASWSAIYCVSPGDAVPENDHYAGHVVFNDPRPNASMHVDAANRHLRHDMSHNAIRLRLQPAELLIFPSYLLHWVEPYRGEEPRITISANFWFHRAQTKPQS